MKLYSVDSSYIDYLRKYFPRVYDNKDNITSHTRKYLGAVLEINELKYFIPLSSPKPKHDYIYINGKRKDRKNSPIVIRMTKNGSLKGTLQIGTMIPIPDDALIDYDINKEEDLAYKELILDEIIYIRKHKGEILKSANLVYKMKTNGSNILMFSNCLDFKGLETVSKNWNKDKFSIDFR